MKRFIQLVWYDSKCDTYANEDFKEYMYFLKKITYVSVHQNCSFTGIIT